MKAVMVKWVCPVCGKGTEQPRIVPEVFHHHAGKLVALKRKEEADASSK